MADDLLSGIFGPQRDPLADIFGNHDQPNPDWTRDPLKPRPQTQLGAELTGGIAPRTPVDLTEDLKNAPAPPAGRVIHAEKEAERAQQAADQHKAEDEAELEDMPAALRPFTRVGLGIEHGWDSTLAMMRGNRADFAIATRGATKELEQASEEAKREADFYTQSQPDGVLATIGSSIGNLAGSMFSSGKQGVKAAVVTGTGGAVGGAAVGGPAGALAGGIGGAGIGMAAGFLQDSYVTNAGQIMGDLREAGVDEDTTKTAGIIGGSIMAGLDMWGIGFVAKPFVKAAERVALRKAIASELETQIAKSPAREALKEYFAAVGVETLTETAQQVVQDVTTDVAKQTQGGYATIFNDPKRRDEVVQNAVQTAITTATGMAALGIPGMVTTNLRTRRENAQQGAAMDAGAPLVTPDDEASPLPTDLIQQGKGTIAQDTDLKGHNDVLAAAGLPAMGRRAKVSGGPLGTRTGTVAGTFNIDGEHGIRIGMDDGSNFESLLSELNNGGHSVQELLDQYLPQGEELPAETQVDLHHPTQATPQMMDTRATALAADLKRRGLDDHVAQGVAAGIIAEAGGDHTALNKTSGAFGLGQWLGSRKQALFAKYGPNPTRNEQLNFLVDELKGGDAGGKFVLAAGDPDSALQAYITKFMRPAKGHETDSDIERGRKALGTVRTAADGSTRFELSEDDKPTETADNEYKPFTDLGEQTLGYARDDMPQIKAEHRGAMVNFLNARGIEHEEETVPADSLHPTQQEYSPAKVEQALGFEGGDRAILVSDNNFIVDGHHQWLAAKQKGEDVRVIRLKAPIDEVLRQAHAFPSSTTAAEQPQSTEARTKPQLDIPGMAVHDDGKKLTLWKPRDDTPLTADEVKQVADLIGVKPVKKSDGTYTVPQRFHDQLAKALQEPVARTSDATAPETADTAEERASNVYKYILGKGSEKLSGQISTRTWTEQMREQIDNPHRYHRVEEEENPLGLKVGDRVTIKSDPDAEAFVVSARGDRVNIQTNTGYGTWQSYDAVEKHSPEDGKKAQNNLDRAEEFAKSIIREGRRDTSGFNDTGSYSIGQRLGGMKGPMMTPGKVHVELKDQPGQHYTFDEAALRRDVEGKPQQGINPVNTGEKPAPAPAPKPAKFDPHPHVPALRDLVKNTNISIGNLEAVGKKLGISAKEAHQVLGALARSPNSGIYQTKGRPAVRNKMGKVVRKAVPPRFQRIAKRTTPLHALEFVRAVGGVRSDRHDLRNTGDLARYPGVINNKSGKSVDEIGEALWEAGYFNERDATNPDHRPTEAETIDLLDKASRQRVYATRDLSTAHELQQTRDMDEEEAHHREELQAIADDAGLDVSEEDITAALDYVAAGESHEYAIEAAVRDAAASTLERGTEETGNDFYAQIAGQLYQGDVAEERGGSAEEAVAGSESQPEGTRERAPPDAQPAGARQPVNLFGEEEAEPTATPTQQEAPADLFGGPTAKDVRQSLEKKGEGRLRSDKEQKAAGSEGGLFNVQDTTTNLFDDGSAKAGSVAASGPLSEDELEKYRQQGRQDRADGLDNRYRSFATDTQAIRAYNEGYNPVPAQLSPEGAAAREYAGDHYDAPKLREAFVQGARGSREHFTPVQAEQERAYKAGQRWADERSAAPRNPYPPQTDTNGYYEAGYRDRIEGRPAAYPSSAPGNERKVRKGFEAESRAYDEGYAAAPAHNQPLAAEGLKSYRYQGRYGPVMIGAKDDADALKEASRSIDGAPDPAKLEVWDGTKYVPAGEATKTVAPKPANYGAKNKLVTREKADELRAQLRAKLNGSQLNAGIDPEVISIGTQLAVFHIEAGARKFGDFAQAIASDLGVKIADIRQYLRAWYNGARDLMEDMGAPVADMDGPDEVRATLATLKDEEGNVPSSPASVEPDRGRAAPRDTAGEEAVPVDGSRAGQGAGSGIAQAGGPRGDQPVGQGGLFETVPAPVRAQGNLGLSGRPSELSPSAAADGGRGGSLDRGEQRLDPERTRPEAVARAAEQNASLEEKRAAQAKANAVPIHVRDRSNIDATLPFLKPEQRDDVMKGEESFAKREGFMLTNGTGTGKTFSGGGLVARFFRQGKRDILVVAPSQDILKDWKVALAELGVDANILESTSEAGKGVTLTTYANLGANPSLSDRKWDLAVADESHKLMSSKDGTVTANLAGFRALTNHPLGRFDRAKNQLRAKWEPLEREEEQLKAQGLKRMPERIEERRSALYEETKALAATFDAQPRTKGLFLSATPFAYVEAVDYANGYLFDYALSEAGERRIGGYNQPDARQEFFITNFGYRMRTGKLTKPDAGVNTEVMEREFHERLKREGALSGRALEVDRDYDRKFVLVGDAVGTQIDQALEFLTSAEDRKFAPLADMVRKRFDYLSRMRLLEAINAHHAVPIIKAHHALGRKVVVFHQYNEGGGFNPFLLDIPDNAEATIYRDGKNETVKLKPLYEEFLKKNPYVEKMDFGRMAAPIITLQRAFPNALLYNGRVPGKARTAAKAAFNTDGNDANLIVVQADAGEAGISLHDTTGTHQRVILNLGMPVRPMTAIQQEGRIYRVGQMSDALFRYLTTGTGWERSTFAHKVAERASTAENLGMGDLARALKQSFIDAYSNAADNHPTAEEGKGGKELDRSTYSLSPFERAKSYYYANGKNQRSRNSREGVDYYATPEPLGFKMAEWANLKTGDKALEPSAGHGAIARFLPEDTDRTVIEPSAELASRAALASPGARMLAQRFEDLHAVNKYDGIVMNPPFGTAGKTAMDHLAKAATHLRNGGRIVALIPTGKMTERFDKWMDSDEAKGIYQVGEVLLPPVTFERAGTQINSRVVILEKQTDKESVAQLGQMKRVDLTHLDSVKELFDRLEDMRFHERVEPQTKERTIEPGADGELSADGIRFKVNAAKDGAAWVAKPGFVPSSRFARLARLSRGAGGDYMAGVGFTFPTEEARNGFLEAVERGDDGQPVISQDGQPQAVGTRLELAETTHAKKGIPLYVAALGDRVESDEFARLRNIAKENGGYWSSYRGAGAIPGFQFESEEARQKFVDKVTAGQTPMMQTAYHGSPHDFDSFSTDHIGSGEGAQVYGWGLYFAGKKDVAEFYKKNLSARRTQLALDGKPINRLELGQKIGEAIREGAASSVTSTDYDYPLGTMSGRVAQELLDGLEAGDDIEHLRRFVDRSDWSIEDKAVYRAGIAYVQQHVTSVPKQGKLYHVDIPEPHEYLDWDKPLTQQSEDVKAALQKLGFETDHDTRRVTHEIHGWVPEHTTAIAPITVYLKWPDGQHDNEVARFEPFNKGTDYHVYIGRTYRGSVSKRIVMAEADKIGQQKADEATHHLRKEPMSGKDAYRVLANRKRNEFMNERTKVIAEQGYDAGRAFERGYNADREASLALLGEGVPGIRYLDGGSRSIGSGTHNYVVFDGSRVNVRAKSQPKPVFYSALQRAIEGSGQNRAPAEQWLATLRKVPGVKQEELEWSGIEDLLKMQQGPVTKDMLLQVLRDRGIKVEEVVLGRPDAEKLADYGLTEQDLDGENEDAPMIVEDGQSQFKSWSSDPSNDTYRELLITLPMGEGSNPERAPSTHWYAEGVVAHVRFMEKQDAEGKRVLFIEEVQSDWHQKGRDQGYEGDQTEEDRAALRQKIDDAENARQDAGRALVDITVRELKKLEADFPERANFYLKQSLPSDIEELEDGNTGVIARATDAARIISRYHEALPTSVRADVSEARRAWEMAKLRQDEARQALSAALSGIPDAPFKSSWPALVMKRAIRWAVDNGYDKVAWTTGEEQASRYNLSQATGPIRMWRPSKAGEPYYVQMSNDAKRVLMRNSLAFAQPRVVNPDEPVLMTAAQLKEAFGADVSNRLVHGVTNEADINGSFQLDGAGLNVGGEGMKAFYDRNLVNITNDIIKKYGAKVGLVQARQPTEAQKYDWATARDSINRRFQSGKIDEAEKQRLERLLQSKIDSIPPNPGFEITPQLAEAAAGGFPLFKTAADGSLQITQEQADKIMFAAMDQLEKLIPGDRVGLRFVDTLRDREGHRNTGQYFMRVITLALDAQQKAWTMAHEAVHAMKAMGLFTQSEWSTLVKAAWTTNPKLQADVRARWGHQNLTEDQLQEEAVAEYFGEYAYMLDETGLSPMQKVVFRAFKRALNLIVAVAKAINIVRRSPKVAAAINAHSIIKAMQSGAIGARPEGYGEAARDRPMRPTTVTFGNKALSSVAHEFEDEESEARWKEATKGIGSGASLLDKAKAGLIDMKNGFTRHWRDLPNEPRFAAVQQKLRQLEAAHDSALEETVRHLRDLVGKLDTKERDIFARKVVLDDLLHEAGAEHELPFGLTPRTLADELVKIDGIVAAHLKVLDAVRKRKVANRQLANAMVKAGVLTPEQVKNPAYYRHMVLDYARSEARLAKQSAGKKVKSPYWARRMGSQLDINANLLEAEFDWMMKARVDIAVANAIEWIKKSEHNIRDQLRRRAKADNKARMDAAAAGDDDHSKMVDAISKKFRQNIAVGLKYVEKVIQDGSLTVPPHLQAAADALMGGSDDASVFPLLSYILDENRPGAMGAGMVLAAVGRRKAFEKGILKDKWVDPEDIKGLVHHYKPEGYAAWQPKEGQHFFTAKTMSEHTLDMFVSKLSEQAYPGVDKEELEKALQSVRPQLVVGGARYTMVLPSELAATLDGYGDRRMAGHVARAFAGVQGAWKRWVLINPRRFFKYNLNNMSGDLDAIIAGKPSSLLKVGTAAKELYAVWRGKAQPSDSYREALERGVFTAGLSAQEIPDINALAGMQHLLREKSLRPDKLTINAVGSVWRGLQGATNFREAVFRYAAYLQFKSELDRGVPQAKIGYGASVPKMVNAVADPADRAALLARDLVGDYGSISAAGSWIRRYLVPFWSWTEINTKRYWRLTANGFRSSYARGMLTGGALGGAVAVRTAAYLYIRMALMYALVSLWNEWLYGDLEDKLSEQQKRQLHIILGSDSTGAVVTLRLQGALSDVLGELGFPDAVAGIKKWSNGQGTLWDAATDMAKAPVNRVATAVSPVFSTPLELATGMEFWPDLFNPRQIHDNWRHVFQTVNIENEYDAARAKPSRGYGRSWTESLVYRRDPGEMSYDEARSITFNWLHDVKGEARRTFGDTPRGEALRDYKLALRYGDQDAAKAALQRYAEYGGTGKGLKLSTKAADPLHAIPKKYRKEFIASLTEDQLQTFRDAEVWYAETYLGKKEGER